MKVQYTATAQAEAEAILAHIADDNPAAAVAVAAAIKAAMARICAFPRCGSETNQAGVFLVVLPSYRYMIFYRLDGDTVVIRNVRHPARRRPR